jgi:hypothetical protein
VLKQILLYAPFPGGEATLSHTDRKPNPFSMSPSIQPACDSVEAKSQA